MSHVKTIEFTKDKETYELEIDAEDTDNLVIENVTHIGSYKAGIAKPEKDVDPVIFEDSLNSDDWRSIREKLEAK